MYEQDVILKIASWIITATLVLLTEFIALSAFLPEHEAQERADEQRHVTYVTVEPTTYDAPSQTLIVSVPATTSETIFCTEGASLGVRIWDHPGGEFLSWDQPGDYQAFGDGRLSCAEHDCWQEDPRYPRPPVRIRFYATDTP